MPHKRNPVGCEQVCGLARIIRANTIPAIENIALWNERDISHSSAERMAIPQSFLLADHILLRMTRILDGLVVRADSMLANLNRMNGMVFSGQVLLDLAAKGISREDAYKMVQGAAMRLWEGGGTLRERLDEDEGITSPPEPRGARRRVRSRRPAPPPRRGLRAGLPGGPRMKFRVRVLVRLRPSVYDPQGEAHPEGDRCRPAPERRIGPAGKMFDLEVKAGSPSEAKARAEEIASRVLANPVLEDFSVQVLLD